MKKYQKKKKKKSDLTIKVVSSSTSTVIAGLLLVVLLLISMFTLSLLSDGTITGAVIGVEIVEVQREHYVSDKEIEILMNRTEDIVEEMGAANLSTLYVRDLFIEMQDEANDYNINYNFLLENSQLILQTREDAFYVRDLLALKEAEIQDYEKISGYTADAAWNIYANAKHAFINERYYEAKELLLQITPMLDTITVEQTRLKTRLFAQTNRLWEWIKNNALAIGITLLIFVGIAILGYKKMQSFLLMKKLHGLLIEQDVISDLMKRAQKAYYTDKKITKQMYAMKMDLYSSRMEEIKSLIPVLQKELQSRRKKRLQKENNEVRLTLLPKIEKKAISETKKNTAGRENKKQVTEPSAPQQIGETVPSAEKEFDETHEEQEKK